MKAEKLKEGEVGVNARELWVLRHESLALAELQRIRAEKKTFIAELAIRERKLTHLLELLLIKQADSQSMFAFAEDEVLTPDLKAILKIS